MRFVISTLAVAAASAWSLPAQATLLTFDGLPSGAVGTTIGTSYGDRVTAAGAGVSLAGGATPNIVLSFVPLVSGNPNFEVYSSGYSGLISALGDVSYNVPGYVELTPDAGWDVVLESFDLGAWSTSSYVDSQVRVVDAAGLTRLDTGLFTFPGSTVYTYPASPIRSSSALRLYISDFGDLGLDNLRFSQVSTVPEPGALALCIAGAGLLWPLARRRQKA
jgi:hypothetical protein